MIIGTYSGGSASAYEYSTLPELLTQLPDNTANQIDALNVRNSVYTLWERISTVQTIASQSASASSYYTNLTPVPVTVGGISAGSTFSNKSMQEMWDALLYPYISPSAALSCSPTYRELGGSNAVTLSWYAYKNTNSIVAIIVDGLVISPVTGNNQSGTKAANAIQNVSTSFSMTVNDGTSTVSASAGFSWYNAIYWGKTSTFAAPSMTIVGSQPAWADGAGVGSGKALSNSKSASYNGINGAGQYLVFAWPTSFGGGLPTFTINNAQSTAFTKIGSAVPHTNVNGYSIPGGYDIWISDTTQNAPIGQFSIS
jgi:hypothetical protein